MFCMSLPKDKKERKASNFERRVRFLALLFLSLGLSRLPASAQATSAHPTWPGPGQLFVGTCYQPVDRSPDQINQDIAIMKHAGFNVVDVKDARGPVDRFFDLSVGSDYPGTLIRDDSQAQLKLVTDELGFRYIRFHAIFHDVLGTVRVENGKTVYDWTKIDQLYDDLLARHIKPFVELGFTPKALATSENSIFYWHGNTSHPKLDGWRDLVDAFVRHLEERYGKDEVRSVGTSRCGMSRTWPASGKAAIRRHTSNFTI